MWGDKATRRHGDKAKEVAMGAIRSHYELDVYRVAFDAAMDVFQVSKAFPKEETYSLTDQILRSSRSVCANIAEVWRKRRYEAAFISNLSDADAEAAETQVWLEFAVKWATSIVNARVLCSTSTTGCSVRWST
jgi:four helix bundle protein